MNDRIQRIIEISELENSLSVEQVRILISDITNVTRSLLIGEGFEERKVLALCTKLRDAGRRMAAFA